MILWVSWAVYMNMNMYVDYQRTCSGFVSQLPSLIDPSHVVHLVVREMLSLFYKGDVSVWVKVLKKDTHLFDFMGELSGLYEYEYEYVCRLPTDLFWSCLAVALANRSFSRTASCFSGVCCNLTSRCCCLFFSWVACCFPGERADIPRCCSSCCSRKNEIYDDECKVALRPKFQISNLESKIQKVAVGRWQTKFDSLTDWLTDKIWPLLLPSVAAADVLD